MTKTKINIDDQVSEFHGQEDSKIREVLNDVMNQLPPNRIVTKVRLNGQTFASGSDEISVLEQCIAQVDDVEIRTADRAIWSATGLDIALNSIERVQTSLIRAAELFREVDKAKANRLFIQCIEGLEKFVEAIAITRSALNLNFDRINYDGYTLTQAENALNQILKVVVNCQERGDYQTLADKVEYELLTNLCTWKAALIQLRSSQNANA